MRTTVSSIGQIETDEIYVGVDKRGAHYILPVQAKGKADQIGVVQIEQDLALCDEKFPELVARPIAAQFMDEDSIALFEFGRDTDGAVVKLAERHYRLVPEHEMSIEDLQLYRNRRLPTERLPTPMLPRTSLTAAEAAFSNSMVSFITVTNS